MMEVMSRRLALPPVHRRRLLGGAAALGAAVTVPLAARVSAETGSARLPADEVPLEAPRSAARGSDSTWRTGPMDTEAFALVGLTWDAGARTPTRVRVRTRQAGSWSSWRTLPLLTDGPDTSTAEGRAARRGTQPLWVGSADGVEVSLDGARPDGLRLSLVDPGRDTAAAARAGADRGEDPTDEPSDEPSATTSPTADPGEDPAVEPTDPTGEPTTRAKVRAPQPDLGSRKDWGADESWRDGKPVLCRTIQQVHVHHTASGNDYSRQDVPALIRSFYRYHTRSLGWSDIGYNFLVDRFGRTWVGRAGGPSRPIRGAHTLGFNHTSVGIAVIGNYESAAAVDRIVTAVVRLAAWKLDRYDRKPRGRTRVYSHGSDKYPKGWVRLKVIDGHRDTNDTACPGDRLYAKLPEIRRRTHLHVKRWS